MAPQQQALATVDAAFWQRIAEQMKAIIGRLEQEAHKRVGKRQPIEQRWIDDLLQYYGRYDAETERKLTNAEQSKLNINLTGPKTDAMAARLMDLLFPTDDKNWGIGPTPVPELAEQASEATRQAEEMRAQAEAAAQQEGADPAQVQQAQQQASAADEAARQLDALVMEGKKRADLMAHEIDDQLKQSRYHAAMRDVIESACKLGTGVCKGPVTGDRVRKGWKRRPKTGENGEPILNNEDGSPVMGDYELEMSSGSQPAMRYVDIWSFFPDMDVSDIKDGEGNFERHLMNRKKLRGLAKLPGFDKDAIRNLLEQKPRTSAPSYLADLRNLTGEKQHIASDLYHVWEYSGPLEADDMRSLALAAGDMDAFQDVQDIDPLDEVNVVVWFCQGELLKFAIYPFDSGECMYSVFNLKKDESSVFGYGIPWIARDPAASLNAGWRAMMDNAGLSSGPQIVIGGTVEPLDGDYTLRPRKLWRAKDGLPPNHAAFGVHNIDTRQEELANIVAISKQFLDDMTAMPQIAQGEQGTGVTKTAQGMALLMNSANVVFRRIVKNFDDDVTEPNIRRFYDWNMQFNPKQEIKGDFEVDARGSSVLLVREMQAQNLMLVAMHFGAHPVYGPMLKNKGVLRNLFKAQMIPADEVMLTDDEIDAIFLQAQSKEGENDPEQMKLDAQVAMHELEWDRKLEIAHLERETALIKMAETMNMSLDKLDAMLTDRREDRASRERVMAAELADKARTGTGAGGYV
ncbi:MAG: hypothetical protein K5872_22230 [Rhizobiaceae bacterium]|nr:hypothetical protein [Rhizobiaceae bacterium]MCV0408939.1 hypothetical protein [Rhizobiaceae bacterium]